MTTMKLRSIGTLLTAFALAACGGNGGGGAAPLALSQLDGYWTGSVNDTTGSPLGASTIARAVVLDNGSAWVFLHDGTQAGQPLLGLATATLYGVPQGFTGTGKRYPASGAALPGDITVSGGAPRGADFDVDVTAGSDRATLELTYDPTWETPAVPAELEDDWTFTKAGGTINATWRIAPGGALTGTSTLGCTYTGNVVPYHVNTAIYTANITETCTGTVKQLSGVARLNTAKTHLIFGLTTTDGAEAEAFAATRQ